MNESLLFEGPIGRMRPEDVLQFVAQAGGAMHVQFDHEDRASGDACAVDLMVDAGRLVGLGPRGTGLRLGDLVVARGLPPAKATGSANAWSRTGSLPRTRSRISCGNGTRGSCGRSSPGSAAGSP